jgi:hypothetical protein
LSVGTSRQARESEIQAAYFAWLKTLWAWDGVPGFFVPVKPEGGISVNRDLCTVWHYTFAVPNGMYVPGDPRRTARIIASMKRQGMKNGVSDVMIALPRGKHCGAFIELKRPGENPTEEQSSWLALTADAGYFATCARGLEDAKAATRMYLDGLEAPRWR